MGGEVDKIRKEEGDGAEEDNEGREQEAIQEEAKGTERRGRQTREYKRIREEYTEERWTGNQLGRAKFSDLMEEEEKGKRDCKGFGLMSCSLEGSSFIITIQWREMVLLNS